ncbi:beta-glucosidase [Bifidobacterium dolichotidis]|uniref:Beta-glucosidase n=1 Tax=Bifidobacterium dolichotidis TaxID=2306976 RepID=A0A430FQU1_9BIFI|nr:GH1 family beta-glucosidase [Bifidobacterium dolichotidis]RSX55190.1 beta-glucosidase [Bifidobacterium dolichotidis]
MTTTIPTTIPSVHPTASPVAFPTAFPPNFMFGTATSAYQIEGAAHEDCRTDSIWDTFSHTPGKVLHGDTGDVAIDFYHHWEDDLKLVRELGGDTFRFSIGVPRIIPTPDGKPNQQGLDFYSRIVDKLLDYGIKPIVTLYHWDLPQYLGDQGGWLNRDTAYRMADYAAIVAKELGDRVDSFTTLNEPWCASFLSYGGTEHAPGLGQGPVAFEAAHHLNLAHGLMCQAVRAYAGAKPQLSVVLNLQENRGDSDAVHRLDLIGNRTFLDPMLRGYYPAELFAVTQGICDWSFVRDGDLQLIHQPIDWMGLNYYSTGLVAMSDRPQFPQSTAASVNPGASDIDHLPTPGEHTAMDWNIDPNGLYRQLMRMTNEYPEIPLVVAENGIACWDAVITDADGVKHVHDEQRIAYLHDHLAAVERALHDGADVRGYFQWSMFDNFEWAFGYERRFGIVYVDYSTQERIRKDSFAWFRRYIAEHRS